MANSVSLLIGEVNHGPELYRKDFAHTGILSISSRRRQIDRPEHSTLSLGTTPQILQNCSVDGYGKKKTYPLPESVGNVEVVKGNIGTVNTNSPTCIIGTRGGSRNIIGDRHRCDLPDLAGKGLEDGSEIVSFATHCFRYTSWECLFVRRS